MANEEERDDRLAFSPELRGALSTSLVVVQIGGALWTQPMGI